MKYATGVKMKRHRFIVVVETSRPRRVAALRILSAFALRHPDGCDFHLLTKAPKRKG